MRYSMEIGQILKTQPIFDFNYEFYDESCKSNFEKKFLDYFYFREIGHETIARFKKSLNTKLNVIMPYYVELYKTMLRSKGLDFMLNKDLVETYSKEIDEITTGLSSSQNSMSRNGNNIVKNLDTPQGNISNLDNYLSGATKSDDSQVSNDKTDLSSNEDKKYKENYVFKSQGNIGVTSSAELLEKWRRTIVNIDKLIIDECEDLFMGVY